MKIRLLLLSIFIFSQPLVAQTAPETPNPVSNSNSSAEARNLQTLFSKKLTPDSELYIVKSGDSLSKIAKKYKTTVDLIKKSNAVSDNIQPGMKLKVSKAKYSIKIDISENKLFLYSNDEILKTYSVATGRAGHETPPGTFEIVNKLIDPVWYDENKAYPPGDPKNILGTRWMGFSLKSYGIHGTTLPETVGTAASEGCIRMHNHEVEELFIIVPQGTKVTIEP